MLVVRPQAGLFGDVGEFLGDVGGLVGQRFLLVAKLAGR